MKYRGLFLLDRSLIEADTAYEKAYETRAALRVECGKKAREIRLAEGVSLREFARRWQMSAAHVSDFERGRWSAALWTNVLAEWTD